MNQNRVQQEEFLFEQFLTNIGFMSRDIGDPHLECLPLAEFSKEGESFDLIVVIAFLYPLFHRHEVGRFVLDEETESFFAE